MINYKTFTILYGEAKEYSNLDLYILERGWQDWMNYINKNDVAKILTDIYEMSVNDIKGILKVSSLTLSALARKFYVPLVTAQKWKAGNRTPPFYTLAMMAYITIADKYFGNEVEEQ